jgi:PhnB protein
MVLCVLSAGIREVSSIPVPHPLSLSGTPVRGSTVNSAYKPAQYNSVAPYLIVNGAAQTIEFLKRVFDAVELRQQRDEYGKLRHAEVLVDDSVVMLADPVPPDWPALPAHVHIYVRDVDATYRRALDAGARSVQEPVKKEDEDKRGGVMDAGGTTWWIATKTG